LEGIATLRVQLLKCSTKELKSLTWFGRDCDILFTSPFFAHKEIEVVDLVWKGLRQAGGTSGAAQDRY